MSVTVTRARTEADCAPVRALAAAHARFERSTTAVPDDWPGRVAGLIAAGRLEVFVASDTGRAVGYASTTTDVSTWTGRPFAHLDCLYVDADRRGDGVGALLLDAVAQHARASGLDELQWQTPAWNTAAIRFYRRTVARSAPKERFTLPLGDTRR